MMDIKISFTLVILAVSTAANVTFAKTTKRLADDAFANNDYAKAVHLYTELIKKDPSDTVYLSLGHAYYKLQDFQHAAQAYTSAAEIQKDSPQAPTLRYLANAQYSLQQYAEALASYHRAVAIDAEPNDTFQIALCYTNLNQWSQARAAILKYLDHSPFAASALELLAHIHLNSSNPQEAAAILYQIVNVNPSSRHHLIGLANALTVANRYGKAIDILEYTLRAVVPGDLTAMQMLADLYTNQQMFSQATNLYRQIATLKPSPSYEDYYRLGYAAMKSKQSATAQNAFRKALNILPDHYNSHLCLARIAVEQFAFDKAHQHYLSAASADLASPEPHIFIADLQISLKNYPLAAQHYGKAILLGRTTPQLYYNCTLALLNAEDYGQARKMLKKALAEYPGHPDLNNLLDQLVALSQRSVP